MSIIDKVVDTEIDVIDDPIGATINMLWFMVLGFIILMMCYILYSKIVLVPERNEKQKKIDFLEENYTKSYIQVYPDMISIINDYNNCEILKVKKEKSVVEGCLNHVTENEKQKTKLTSYLDEKAKISEKVWSERKLTREETLNAYYKKNEKSFTKTNR